MENPATWGDAEKIVDQVLAKRHEQNISGQFMCGLSLPRQITDALREAGLLVPETPCTIAEHMDAATSAVPCKCQEGGN